MQGYFFLKSVIPFSQRILVCLRVIGIESPSVKKEFLSMRKLSLILLSGAFCTAAAVAQVNTESTGSIPADVVESSTSPVAWVYVSSSSGIVAYHAAPSGKLTHIAGSPFSADVAYLVSNGKYLFGSTQSGTDIDAYSIESDGALRYATSTSIPTASDSGCGSAGALSLDHTGASLYNLDFDGQICANNSFQAFKIKGSTGGLAFLNNSGGSPALGGPISFLGNNKFAYTAGSFHSSGGIFAFRRNSNGSLTALNFNPAIPGGYTPGGAAADPTDHVATSVQDFVFEGEPSGPPLLATYTADSSGNLTTTSTVHNMPKVLVVNVTSLNMAPSGKLLAVAGTGGLQVFHFNGASPITHYTGLLTSDEVDQVYWDNKNHLYAIGSTSNKLWVFTVTPTSHGQAPGSPYAINAPGGLVVLPLPLFVP
jgi:6-phosphogluconolactonase (cycloisomerase 2 family)